MILRSASVPAAVLLVFGTLTLTQPVRADAPKPAPSSVAEPADAKGLRARIDQWWAARQNRDMAAMYALFTPAFRDATPLQKYTAEFTREVRFDLLGYQVVSMTADGPEKARVRLTVKTRIPQASDPISMNVEEAWQRVDGTWFRVHDELVLPFNVPGAPAPVATPSASPASR